MNQPTGLTADILKRVLNIIANNKSKIYGLDNPSFNESYINIVQGETINDLSYNTTVDISTNVGTYNIYVSGGSNTSNYDISYSIGTLTITKAPLTVNAINNNKIYGEIDPALTNSYAGLRDWDTIDISSSRAVGEDVSGYVISNIVKVNNSLTLGNYALS